MTILSRSLCSNPSGPDWVYPSYRNARAVNISSHLEGLHGHGFVLCDVEVLGRLPGEQDAVSVHRVLPHACAPRRQQGHGASEHCLT